MGIEQQQKCCGKDQRQMEAAYHCIGLLGSSTSFYFFVRFSALCILATSRHARSLYEY